FGGGSTSGSGRVCGMRYPTYPLTNGTAATVPATPAPLKNRRLLSSLRLIVFVPVPSPPPPVHAPAATGLIQCHPIGGKSGLSSSCRRVRGHSMSPDVMYARLGAPATSRRRAALT